MISGIVIHLSADETQNGTAVRMMSARSGVELGKRVDRRLPMVVESTATASVDETTEWLRNLTGVLHVDVTFVHLEE